MSKRIRTQTKPFSSWTAGDAALMSSRKFKSRSKVDILIKNLNYRELAKSMKTPVSNPPTDPKSTKVTTSKKVKPVENPKPSKKDRSCDKKKNKSGVKMKFNTK